MSTSTQIFLATAIPSGIVFVILCSTCLVCCCFECESKIKQQHQDDNNDNNEKQTGASAVEDTSKVGGEETIEIPTLSR